MMIKFIAPKCGAKLKVRCRIETEPLAQNTLFSAVYGRQPEWFTLCNLVRTISRPPCLIGLLLGRWLGWEANWYGMDFYFLTQAHTLPGAQPKMQPGSMVASTQGAVKENLYILFYLTQLNFDRFWLCG